MSNCQHLGEVWLSCATRNSEDIAIFWSWKESDQVLTWLRIKSSLGIRRILLHRAQAGWARRSLCVWSCKEPINGVIKEGPVLLLVEVLPMTHGLYQCSLWFSAHSQLNLGAWLLCKGFTSNKNQPVSPVTLAVCSNPWPAHVDLGYPADNLLPSLLLCNPTDGKVGRSSC